MKTKKLSYKDLEKIKSAFEEIGGDKATVGIPLVEEAMFCCETLEQLKAEIKANGVVTEMCQGNYSIQRENPALKSYNTTIKNFQSLIKQICNLLPDSNGSLDDGFDDFGE